jgi:hypothetical protein
MIKPKNPKKQHPHHNNKKNKGPKRSQPSSPPNADEGEKYKSKNIDRHCNFCGKYAHDESKRFKKMASLKVVMKKHKINIDSTSSSSSHEH